MLAVLEDQSRELHTTYSLQFFDQRNQHELILVSNYGIIGDVEGAAAIIMTWVCGREDKEEKK